MLMPRYPSIADISGFLEDWAPTTSAQSYDNVGLQIGNPSIEVRKGLIALDMTPAVLEEARSEGANLIVTHHPLIFRGLSEVTTRSPVSNLVFGLISNGIALYSMHTNLDAAIGGVSFALGQVLGLTDMDFLDVFDSEAGETGLGVIGRLDVSISLGEFLEHVAERLDAPVLRFVGDLDTRVERVAVCGGSGSEFAGCAIDAGADVFVTADVKYHRFFEVLDVVGRPKMALVDAGHYETEAVTESLLRDELADRFSSVDWRKTRHRTSPVSTFVRRT